MRSPSSFSFLSSFLLLSFVFKLVPAQLPAGSEKCFGVVIENLPVCVEYGSGKSPKPAPACCSGVSKVYKENKVCLCLVIQAVGRDSEELKSLNLKLPKLLELPRFCNIAGANITECITLLKLSPNSPDYKFFTPHIPKKGKL